MPDSDGTTARRTALIIEDDEDTRFALRVEIESNGFVVYEAATQEEARAALVQYHPDVITLDGNVPTGPGTKRPVSTLELSRWIRVHFSGLIIVISGEDRARLEELEQAIRSGPHAVLPKPMSLSVFEAAISQAT